jgi:plastocyanin
MAGRVRHIALRSSSTALIALGGLTLTACGGGKPVDLDAGKASFTAKCASCHALAKAGSPPSLAGSSKVGPNLDDAFRGDRQQGFQDSEFEATVRKWIEIAPQKAGRVDQLGGRQAMPANIAVGEEADNIAAYVASAAGTDAESTVIATPAAPKLATATPEGESPTANAGTGDTSLDLAADANNALAFNQKSLTAPAGKVTLNLKNPSVIPHNIAIKGNGITEVLGPIVDKDGLSTATADLAPGTYEYFCSVPGHEGAGMKGTLVVTGDAPAGGTGAAPTAPVNGVQTEALAENPAPSFKGPRIVGPWLTLKIRDRRFSRLSSAVAARSFKIDKYVKPGFWIRIDPK